MPIDSLSRYDETTVHTKCSAENEIGVLLGFDLINGYPNNACVGTTIVSSRLLGTIAEAMVLDNQTLTGFKWIANGAMERELKGKRFLMGYEKALITQLVTSSA